MADKKHFDIKGSHSLDSIENEVCKRSHDASEIIVKCFFVFFMIRHFRIKDIIKSIMGTKAITGNKGFFLVDIGKEDIRPMEEKTRDKGKCILSDLHLFSCSHDHRLIREAKDVL